MLNPISPENYGPEIPQFLNVRILAEALPTKTASTDTSPRAYAEGQTIIRMMGLGSRAYIVTSGELAIYLNGLPVDIIEAGEYFDESICIGGQVVAHTDCTLRPVAQPQPQPQPQLIQH